MHPSFTLALHSRIFLSESSSVTSLAVGFVGVFLTEEAGVLDLPVGPCSSCGVDGYRVISAFPSSCPSPRRL